MNLVPARLVLSEVDVCLVLKPQQLLLGKQRETTSSHLLLLYAEFEKTRARRVHSDGRRSACVAMATQAQIYAEGGLVTGSDGFWQNGFRLWAGPEEMLRLIDCQNTVAVSAGVDTGSL